MKEDEPMEEWHPLECFHAGLPPFSLFIMNADDTYEVVRAFDAQKDIPADQRDEVRTLNTAAELGVMGLIAHFEAFCRHLFAALANAAPPLLTNLSERRHQTAVPLRDLLPFGPNISANLGFVVAEHFDFGSAKNINRLFEDLVDFTPINRDEGAQLDDIVFDRNLLTHHGGVYSMTYAHERKTVRTERGGVYFDSLVITAGDFFRHDAFIVDLCRKMSLSAPDAVNRFLAKKDIGDSYPLFDLSNYLTWSVADKRRHE